MAMTSLLDRLSAERQRRFVGRNLELKLFEQAIASKDLPFHILYVFGPGGVGKTTLIRQFSRVCEQSNIRTITVEGRSLEPTAASFLSALRSLMGLNKGDSPLQVLAEKKERHVIFIDTYETLTQIDEWLREEFLPHVSENTLVAIAGRNPLSSGWRSDPGWQALIHTVSLNNLAPEESLTYLKRRDVPAAQYQAILDFTHGHPLALSLVADLFAQGKNIHFQADAPNIVKSLLERFIQELPTTLHRMALEACAVVRITTEASLAQMLELADAHNLFEWLRGLSFIESGHTGLFPHDLAREVLIADLRWRNPDFYAQLHHRARHYYTNRLGQTQGQEKHVVLFDYMFLHRDNPAIRPRFTWSEHSGLLTDSLRENDNTSILQMVIQYEGEASAKITYHWLKRQPENVLVFRDSQNTAVGFAMMIALHEASSEDLEIDPGVKAAWQYLEKYAPLRLSEGATIFRFWMGKDTYQAVSPTQSLIFINFVQYFQKTPGLAYTFLPCAEPDAWAPMLTYFDMKRVSEADFQVGERSYGVYGHDWRVVSPSTWQQLLAQREITASSETITTSQQQPTQVLSQSDFTEAVHDLLRNYTRPHTLHNNPLVHCCLVEKQQTRDISIDERIEILRNLIRETAEFLKLSPREEKLYRALHRTYISPASTQEQAAELLDLPFSTYRRHLKAGMIRVAEILWQREIG
jgi:DNA polymerase III delta prime subunit